MFRTCSSDSVRATGSDKPHSMSLSRLATFSSTYAARFFPIRASVPESW